MSALNLMVLLLALSLLAGCNTLRGAKLFAPEQFGLEPIAALNRGCDFACAYARVD